MVFNIHTARAWATETVKEWRAKHPKELDDEQKRLLSLVHGQDVIRDRRFIDQLCDYLLEKEEEREDEAWRQQLINEENERIFQHDYYVQR